MRGGPTKLAGWLSARECTCCLGAPRTARAAARLPRRAQGWRTRRGSCPAAAGAAEGPAWPLLRVLAGITLPASAAEPLAGGLPNLKQLEADLAGGGWGMMLEGGAAFSSVTWVRIYETNSDFSSSHHALARLAPNVERVEWRGLDSSMPLHVACDFSPLTRLVEFSSKWIQGHCGDIVAELQPSAWESLATLTRLSALSLALDLQQLPRLCCLPPSVETLTLHVAPSMDWPDKRQGTCELGAVLEVALRAPGLRALRVYLPAAELQHSRSLARAAAMGSRLRVLEVAGTRLALRDIGTLAAMPALSWLAVFPARELKSDHRLSLSSLVGKCAAEGLRIELDARPRNSLVAPSHA